MTLKKGCRNSEVVHIVRTTEAGTAREREEERIPVVGKFRIKQQ